MEEQSKIREKVISGLFWKFSERIVAQLVSVFISIVLARILTPEDYGVVALVMIFITIANVFVSNGFGNALIQKKNADNLDFSSVFYINIGIGIICYMILFLIAPWIALLYKMPILTAILRVLGIRIIVASINSVQHAYVSKHMLFKRFFWSTLFGTVLSGIVGIAAAYKGLGVWALVIQYLVNAFVDTVVLWFTVKWRPLACCSFKRAYDLLTFGWKLLVSGLIDTGYTQLRGLIIGKMYSSADLAYYNQGEKYPSLICVNINSSIGSVLLPAMAQNQNNPDKVKNMTRRAIQVSSYILWPIMLGLAAVAEPLISVVLTEKWLECVPYLQIFCFTYGLWPIHTANLQAINAMGRSDIFLKLEILKKIIGIVALLLTMNYGPIYMAASLIVTGIISTFINAYPNRKLLNYSFKEQVEDMLPSFLMAISMSIIVQLLAKFSIHPLFMLIFQILLGVVIYSVLSILIKPKAFRYLINMIKIRLRFLFRIQ